MNGEIPESPILFDPTIYYADVCRADEETSQKDSPATAYARELADYLGANADPDYLTAIYTAAQRACRTSYTIMGANYDEDREAVVEAFKARANNDPSWTYTQERARQQVTELGLHGVLQDISSQVCTTGGYPEQGFAYNIGAICILQIHELRQEQHAAAQANRLDALFAAIIGGGDEAERKEFEQLEATFESLLTENASDAKDEPRKPEAKEAEALPEEEWQQIENIGAGRHESVETAAKTIKLLADARRLIETVKQKTNAGVVTDVSETMLERFGFDRKNRALVIMCEQVRALGFLLSGKNYYYQRYEIDKYHKDHPIPEHKWHEQTTLYQMAIDSDEVASGRLRMCLDLLEWNSENADKEYALAYAVGCTMLMQIGIHDTNTALTNERSKLLWNTRKTDSTDAGYETEDCPDDEPHDPYSE